MRIVAEPVVLPHVALTGADWADRWSIVMPGRSHLALGAAQDMLGHPPVWVEMLMSIRNRIVALFGLKKAELGVDDGEQVGGFPVVYERPERVVLGFDDSHLDFRIVVDVEPEGEAGSRISVTTLVKRHNLFGRLYIAVVTPFHRLIVRTTLARLTDE